MSFRRICRLQPFKDCFLLLDAILTSIILILFLIGNNRLIALATFSPSFSTFLTQKYGKFVEEELARRDLGIAGSFGGGEHLAGERTRYRPILMVHGLSTIAGEYENLRQYFLLNGYSDAEIFASSYGHGKLSWTKDSMECQHVKRVSIWDWSGWNLNAQLPFFRFV
jgi:hypothetical protein